MQCNNQIDATERGEVMYVTGGEIGASGREHSSRENAFAFCIEREFIFAKSERVRELREISTCESNEMVSTNLCNATIK
jgi:hypothetical protein